MHPQIWQIVKLYRKTKTPNFVTKNAWLDIFDQECLIWVFLGKNVLINYCHIWKQHLQICQVAKFCKKTKLPNWVPQISYLGIFGIEI